MSIDCNYHGGEGNLLLINSLLKYVKISKKREHDVEMCYEDSYLILSIFHEKFCPLHAKKWTKDSLKKIKKDNSQVSDIVSVISKITRTNFYTSNCQKNKYISFKINEKEANLSFNIRHKLFVFSDDMEAIHMREGNVSRGGIRWSDLDGKYQEDFQN